MSSIVLTGGGTAGHCIPHLAILPDLQEKFQKIYYIGRDNSIEKRLMEKQTEYYSISAVPLKRSLTLQNLLVPFKLYLAVREAKSILKKLKPNVVFSKGGYVALPVTLAAFSLKIPVVCHESDLSLGLANKLSAKKSDLVITTFKETALSLKNGKYLGALIRKSLISGDRELAKIKFGFDDKKPVLLVFGGSSGSQKINQVVCDALPELLKKYYVLHICGSGKLCTYSPTFGYFKAEFLNDMAAAFAVSDMAISRGGSGAVFELIATKKPSLIIPLGTGGSRGDQIENANYFSRKGMCHKLMEDDLNSKSLLLAVDKLYERRNSIIKAIEKSPSVIGNDKIAEVLLSYS